MSEVKSIITPGRVIAILATTVVVACVLYYRIAPPTESAKDIERVVIETARTKVKDALISPATAKFVDEKLRYERIASRHFVMLAVDSQNQFGALIRRYFVVEVGENAGRFYAHSPRELDRYHEYGGLNELARQVSKLPSRVSSH